MESRIAPVADIVLSNNAVAENNPKDSVVGLFSTVDATTGETVQFSLIDGVGAEDNQRFSLIGQELRTAESFNFEARNDFSIRVLATGSVSGATEKIFQVHVTDLNDAPINQLPSLFHGFEKSQLLLSGLGVRDEDAGLAKLKITLSVTEGAGTFFVPDDIPGGLIGTEIFGSNTSAITLFGPLVRLNATLGAARPINFFPAGDFSGSLTLTMTTDDLGNSGPDGPKSTTDTSILDIASVNNPPTVSPVADPVPIDEDAGEQLLIISGISPGLNPIESTQQVTVDAESDNPLLIANVKVSGSGSTREVRYTPLPNAYGSATITVTIRDNGGTDHGGIDHNSTSFRVAVNSVNDAPILDDAKFGFSGSISNGFLLGTIRASDPDLGDESTYQIESGNSDGAVTLDAKTGQITVANANLLLNGSNRTLVISSTDRGLLSDTATITLVRDQPPSLAGSGLPDLFKLEDNAPFTASLSGAFIDDGPLSFALVGNSNPDLLSVTLAGTNLSFEPKADQFGVATIRIRATDIAGQSIEDEFSVTLTAVNDRPTLETGPVIIAEILPANTVNNMGSPVSALTKSVSDRDQGSLKGIAIVGTSSGPKIGVWETSNNSGTTWTSIDSTSETHALLLADLPENRIRFKPQPGFNGFARLQFKAWDRTTGLTGEFADTTTGTAFSLELEKATTVVGRTTPVVDADGIPQLTPIEKDQVNPAGEPVRNLTGILVSDPDPKTTAGIAVTAADNSHGHWQYSSANSWIDITTVSENSGVLLGPTTKIRFVPEQGFAGMATLKYHAWDQSVGQIGERADVSGNAFSVQSLTASIRVVARPVLDITAYRTLPTVNSSSSVEDLLKGNVSDFTPGQPIGIAVVGTSGNGVWTYQIGGADAVTIKATQASALLLPAEAILRFTPATGFRGVATLSYRAWNTGTLPALAGTRANSADLPFSKAIETLSIFVPSADGNARPSIRNRMVPLGTITEDPKLNAGQTVQNIVRAAGISDANRSDRIGLAISATDATNGDWQFSFDGKTWLTVGAVSNTRSRLLPSTARVRFVPKPDYFGQTECSFLAWDGTDGSPGDIADTTIGTGFSVDSTTARWNITPVNDLPRMDVSRVFLSPSIAAGTGTASIRVGDLLNGASDVETTADQIGVAINSASGPGSWQVSTDGLNFIPLAGSGVILPPSAMLRFVGNPGKTGIAALNYQAWDGTPARGGRPVPDSLSIERATLKIAVGNSAPMLTGPGAMDNLSENPKSNPGKTVSALLGDTILDSPGSKRGIAVTGVSSPIAGDWQYSLDRGKTWLAIGSAADTDAWLLPDTAKIRFAPGKDVHTAPGSQPAMTYKAWDQTVGVPGQRVDTTKPGVNAFSSAVTTRMTVTAITQSPILDTSRLQTLDGPILVSKLISRIASSRDASVFGISVISATGPGSWQVDLGDGFKDIKTIDVNARLLNQNVVLRFVPKPGASGLASLRFKAWDQLGGPERVSQEIETLAINIGNRRPLLEVF